MAASAWPVVSIRVEILSTLLYYRVIINALPMGHHGCNTTDDIFNETFCKEKHLTLKYIPCMAKPYLYGHIDHELSLA